ncbi:Homeo [Glarea lozoyensis ATCC 20868]|uniref:Homeo n=1 Tax=Glarea lozoyensis (strain ATCC 20868 / MF5171) TaxID=1116229 RepID=S3DC66_GLAL2|nr:Homeo [Glarea lozoyensis ATCC 20868]EPE35290.1 Homeo [Glarea lozoyensis ATCC 20868]
MPKTDRVNRNSLRNSGHYYNLSPVTTGQQYADLNQPRLSTDYYSVQPIPTMAPTYNTSTQQNTYSTGGPVQPIHQTYAPVTSHIQSTAPITSLRPSSGAWSPTDDQTLMGARSQGMNWAPIQQTYFPTKTPNACRKRHERLMERRSADDWDGLKLEGLAKNYMGMRREIWSSLAEATGEKWNVVEQKCMSQGLKNLQTAARSHARRERLLSPSHSHSHHTSLSHSPNHAFPPYSSSASSGAYVRDDSGIEIEDMEGADYNDGSSERMSSSSSAYGGQHYGHGHSHSGGSGVGSVGYGHNGRLPSIDMGIDAIINRPRQ